MFKLQRLEITGFKSFADHTDLVFSGAGITAVVGPNGCGKSNVSDAISWVLGEQRAKTLRGGEMKDVVFQGTKTRKPGGMAEVVLHLVRDDSFFDVDEDELEDIDETLSGIDESAVDMAEIEGVEPEDADILSETVIEEAAVAETEEVETVQALAVGATRPIETKIKTKRHWRPRSFALDFAPGEAVSVARRLYLSGESEYILNGKTCRLRDITDLFAGTGLSGAHYAIIEQGRIGQILSAKPADRRGLIEEAAGISKFRARQRAAETRLESAKSNLARIFDIVSEIETRVNSLRRQAAKTRRFKILQEAFRELLRQLYAAEGRYLTALLEDLRMQLATAETTETELQQQLLAKEESVKEATSAARSAEESLSELRGIHSTNALERDRAEREHLYKSDQIVGLNTRGEALRTDIETTKARLAMLETEIERLRREEEVETTSYTAAQTELRASEEAHGDATATFAGIESSLEILRAELMQHVAAVERFDEIGRQLSNNIERLEARRESLTREGERAAETHQANRTTSEQLIASLAFEETKLAELNAEKDQLFALTTDARTVLRSAESELAALQDEHSAKRHRLSTLVELDEKKAVHTPAIQKIFAEQDTIGVNLGGVLADRLNVSPDAEKAIESLFGPFLEAVVVDTLADAKRLSAWLRENEIGRTAIIILPAGSEASSTVNRADTIAGVLGISPELESMFRSTFSREMSARLVGEITDAEIDGVQVDREGDILVGGRLFIAGSRHEEGQNESLLAFKRELKDLEVECSTLASSVERAAAAANTARNALIDSESKMVDLQSLIIKVDRGIHGLQIQVHSAREEIDRADRHRKVVADELAQVETDIADATQKRGEAAASKQTAETERGTLMSRIDTVTAELNEARSRVESANAVLNERRMIAATSDERRRGASSALKRVENESRELESRLALQNLELNEAVGKIRELHEAVGMIADRIASAGDEMESENTELTSAIEALAAAREASDRTSEELAALNRRLGEARNERAAVEVRQAEAVTELKNITEQCEKELNTHLSSLASEIEPDEDFVLDEARANADDLRQRLENFGAINMLALEELAESEERHIFLTGQRQDIVDSIAATEEALREIKQRSRDKFRTAFDAINANFREFFQELFGGGRGEMTLLEADDILEAGIEVVAQPPGKRLQNILLLSGGEKAMTAIALVMSIFKYRPSPFCLLDEVDAPLDDANVGRFVDKIASMSEKTQFIVITHNKRTMEAAKALYGVTMQEAGVSKVVSVKFE